MPDFAAEMTAIMDEVLAEGYGAAVTYTPIATGVGASITATWQETGQPYIHSEGAEVRRREMILLVLPSAVAAPAKGDTATIASGIHAGTWTVIEVSNGDAAAWLLTVRLDDRTRMGTGRRLP